MPSERSERTELRLDASVLSLEDSVIQLWYKGRHIGQILMSAGGPGVVITSQFEMTTEYEPELKWGQRTMTVKIEPTV